jgi:hypothetical protein
MYICACKTRSCEQSGLGPLLVAVCGIFRFLVVIALLSDTQSDECVGGHMFVGADELEGTCICTYVCE